MQTSRSLTLLSILTGLLALVQSAAGLFWQQPGAPFAFTTLRGEVVQINGQGLYYYDTYFKAPLQRGADAITLFIVIPLLAVAIVLYRRGGLRGKIFLTGVLSYFLYNAASVALGVAYNNLTLAYIAYFSASLFAFVLAFTTVDRQQLGTQLSPRLPRRGIAILVFLAGAAVLFAWLTDLIAWLAPGAMPGVTSYTTEITYALDLGIITPATILAGVLVLRRAPLGYLLAATLLILLVLIGGVVTAQTVFQMQAGIEVPPQALAGKAGSFAALSLFAAGLLIRFFQSVGAAQTPGEKNPALG